MTEDNQELRPYQREVGRAILDSVAVHRGLTFTVEIARQGGKNELSAHIEAFLLSLCSEERRNMIKCSPTFKPQTITSMLRLKEKLDNQGLWGTYRTEMGYIIRLGECRAIFLSADSSASVVGHTAHLLLEVDEAQDVNEEKYTKEFKPMGSTTNVTNVLYGTTWDGSTLLEKVKQNNLELERRDGLKRHFRFDWQEIAKYNPDYQAYVEAERLRLGENHPLFLTQYRLLPIRGGGGFLNAVQKSQLQGNHARRRRAEPGKIYVAGVDLAGEEEAPQDQALKSLNPRRDSTVMTVAELQFDRSQLPDTALIKIVEHYAWTGRKHPELYRQVTDLIKNTWNCRRVAVDATGIGEPAASFWHKALGSRIIPFKFTAASKTELGFNLLAAVNAGGLKMYAGDNSQEYAEFWLQIEKAKGYYRPSQTLNFYVDPADGHDDYLISLALLVEASQGYLPRQATGHLTQA